MTMGHGASDDDAPAQPQSPAYVRKQATQPKPLSSGIFGSGSWTRRDLLIPLGAVALILVLVAAGWGTALAASNNAAHAPATTSVHIRSTATVSDVQTALDNLPTATPAPTVTPAPTATATPLPTATPRPAPTATPLPPAPPTPCPGVNCNPWGYNFTPGNLIYSPPGNFCTSRYFTCISSFSSHTNGYVVECHDGDFSHSGGVQGACSYHGGEWRPLYSH